MRYCEYLKQRTAQVLAGSVLRSANGVDLYTPDGFGNYRALWTRDFAYMVEGAGDLIPLDKQKACLEYLIAGAREQDGWIPDRVDTEVRAIYTAGAEDFPGLPNLDNGPFLVLAAECYLARLPQAEADRQFDVWRSVLCRGIACLPTDKNGLIENNSTPPHSPYGFTDCICKTGVLAMESLLLWRAVKVLAARTGDVAYSRRADQIEAVFADTFSDESGMLFAATGIGRQIDIWASCYAVSIGFPLSEKQKAGIADWLAEHYDGIVMMGQVRHLPKGEYWEKTLTPVEHEEYQNGAFWATPSGWFYDAIEGQHPALAARLMAELVDCFQNDGIWECINKDGYRKLDPYAASAANVYGCCKKHGL